jgi:hypothetical protein
MMDWHQQFQLRLLQTILDTAGRRAPLRQPFLKKSTVDYLNIKRRDLFCDLYSNLITTIKQGLQFMQSQILIQRIPTRFSLKNPN